MNAYYDSGWVGPMVFSSIGADGMINVNITDDSNVTRDTATTPSSYDDGENHFLVIVKSGTNLIVYVDGVSVITIAVVNATGTLNNDIATMRVGSAHHLSFPNTDGSIGHIQFGYYAPSAEQIAVWYEEDPRLFKKYSALQIVGESYSMDVPHETSDGTDVFDGSGPDDGRSYGGNSQTIITDEYDEYNLSTSILEDVDVSRFAAFLRSTYGELFTYDELGTIAAPYEPIVLENVTPRRRRVRVGTLPRTMKFSYKARTV
jgi:hypothetical protein